MEVVFMDWLKKILESAKIEDGKLNIDSILESVNTEFPKYAVPKDKYNTLSTTKGELETQLKAANKQIEDFKGMDIDGIKKAADDWKLKAEKAETDAQAKITALQFNSALEIALSKSGAKSAKALKGLLDMDKIKFENDTLSGLDEQLKTIKEENDYLFGTEPNSTGLPQGGSPTTLSGVEAAFYAKNPDLKPE